MPEINSNDAAAEPVPPASFSLFELKDGGYDAGLNKHIQEVVLVTDTFIVYLATDSTIQWQTTDEHDWDDRSGEVLNRVALLETRSRFIEDKATLNGIRRQIGEGLARYLDDNQVESALIILREVELEIEVRNKEVCWEWYFYSAYRVTLLCVLTIIALWLSRNFVREQIGLTAFDVVLGTLCGAIGALLSATTRSNRLHLDANAGKRIHTREGLSRIGVGLAGAAFVALAIKGGALLGGARFAGSQSALLLAFCVAAGASERMVPNLIG